MRGRARARRACSSQEARGDLQRRSLSCAGREALSPAAGKGKQCFFAVPKFISLILAAKERVPTPGMLP